MKVAIRYYSRGGNVQTMAEAISRATGIEAISVDEESAEITSHVDLLFIGAALYSFQLDPIMKKYLEELPEGLIDEAVCFGSSLLTRRPIYLMQERLKNKGIKLNKQAIWSRGRPNEDLLGVIEYFANNELTRDRSLDGLPPYLVFKRSQELKAQREAAKAEGRDFEAEQEAAAKRRAAEAALAEAKEAEEAARAAQVAAQAAAEEAAEAARLAAEKLKEATAAEDALTGEAQDSVSEADAATEDEEA